MNKKLPACLPLNLPCLIYYSYLFYVQRITTSENNYKQRITTLLTSSCFWSVCVSQWRGAGSESPRRIVGLGGQLSCSNTASPTDPRLSPSVQSHLTAQHHMVAPLLSFTDLRNF